jgi:uncharacterized protein YheU (UPF0270 family)
MSDESAAKDLPLMQVPWDRLSPAALEGVMKEFILQEGTEYGAADVALETKLAQVRRQLEEGDACILFDARDESCQVVRAKKFQPILR